MPLLLIAFGGILVWAVCSYLPSHQGPRPPSSYQAIGSVGDFPIGATMLRPGVWVIHSDRFIDALKDNPSCPFRLVGASLEDCQGRIYSKQGNPTDFLLGANSPPDQQKFCTWVWGGKVYVYFRRLPSSSFSCPG